MTDGYTAVTAAPRFAAERCSLKDILERVGDKWSILVVAALARQPYRFRALQRDIEGISQRMLTLTLQRLERDGLITRTVIDMRPPRVEYALTATGQSLTVPLRALADWAEEHRATITASRADWDSRQPADQG
ncbi:DNA-binding HxlR family transcriptional regulator [Microbacterium sp. SORGH_AS 1204]|uniref:winged helix-turn-helix transcriptional regulator n=1 Tax=Microbacterium sp. SORGH_AS_1204 TaxID=3041785 RepID=UPI002793010E|nr:helix-turn-helix domain-containing protein [Microbacterium sp. SORGH_AS_1204]MDQ1135786.1 DNA-binding HxlR family transcriptional regulator [Microbacterium sp. SORGH_AS_1204]